MVIVQINYRRPDMPKAEWEARYTDERAAQFLKVPGLQWKIWLDGDAERLRRRHLPVRGPRRGRGIRERPDRRAP